MFHIWKIAVPSVTNDVSCMFGFYVVCMYITIVSCQVYFNFGKSCNLSFMETPSSSTDQGIIHKGETKIEPVRIDTYQCLKQVSEAQDMPLSLCLKLTLLKCSVWKKKYKGTGLFHGRVTIQYLYFELSTLKVHTEDLNTIRECWLLENQKCQDKSQKCITKATQNPQVWTS